MHNCLPMELCGFLPLPHAGMRLTQRKKDGRLLGDFHQGLSAKVPGRSRHAVLSPHHRKFVYSQLDSISLILFNCKDLKETGSTRDNRRALFSERFAERQKRGNRLGSV
jgi:hypothetical protein